ncbi:hypothetical protein COCVIDRAFT_35860 [Bipolaris victoriae FI3]|uniref:Cyanovirin-N domain-containing protein n=1 Tax=Bipolaris victoriae (strain FI3) TaxID=930091 RepID=W7EQ97_BIPV3|nr:hypothetical protein COCVIDRAFT_35860 [Bipolaris victoriae FI3]
MVSSLRHYLQFLAILCFASFPLVNALLAEEGTLAGDDSGVPPTPFNEAALLAVLDQSPDQKSPANLFKIPIPFTGDPNPQPNGDCQPLSGHYAESADDILCNQKHRTATLSYASRRSLCSNGGRRIIECQLCYGLGVAFPSAIYVEYQTCGGTKTCAQGEERYNRWGRREPFSNCVPTDTIFRAIIAKGSALREYCTSKFTFSSAGGGKGRNFAFKSRLYNSDTGDREPAKWMYLKIDGAYARSAQSVEDWSTTFEINQNDKVEMCAYPFDTGMNLELDWSASFA